MSLRRGLNKKERHWPNRKSVRTGSGGPWNEYIKNTDLRPRPELGGKVIAVHGQLDELADVPEARIEQKRKALAQQKECQDRKWWAME